MEFKEWLLNEMRVQRFGNNPELLFAFRDNIWLVDRYDDDADEVAQEIWDTIRRTFNTSNLPQEVVKRLSEEEATIDDLESFFRDWLKDGVVGYWDEDSGNLNISMVDNPSPISSPLMKKIATTLDASDITYDNEEVYDNPYKSGYDYEDASYSYDPHDMIGNVPDNLWHGTTTEYFPSIVKYGLMPGEGASNFARNQIYHDDKIFLADRESEVRYYSANAAREQGGYPMVVNVKIPDPSKLLPDYDVDRYATGSASGKNTYSHMGYGDQEWEISSVGSWKSTKHAGKYGYKGRIPANYILSIQIRFNQDGWQEIDIPYAKQLIWNYGDEGWHYYGMDLDEIEEEEWD